jgi:hypothetical protein
MADFTYLERVSITSPTPDPGVFEKAAEILEKHGIIHRTFVEFRDRAPGQHGAVCPEAAIRLAVHPDAFSSEEAGVSTWFYTVGPIIRWASAFAFQMRWTDEITIASWTDENEVSCEEGVRMLKNLAEGARRLRALEG